jgi:hypothetical protein
MGRQYDYDTYNREERYICSHLFRLLHEPVEEFLPLRRFLGGLQSVDGFRIYAEVALIRDAYHVRRDDVNEFMDSLVDLIAEQEGVTSFRLYSQLVPEELCTPHLTHPGQILKKGADSLTDPEHRVYGALQGMFNAKPDLAICLGDQLVLFEAKLTLGFDTKQLDRTKAIAEVWSKLLDHDLGFTTPPEIEVRKLGLARFDPDVSWEAVSEIAQEIYPEHDRSRRAFVNAIA